MLAVLIVAWRLLAFIILFIRSMRRSSRLKKVVRKISKETIAPEQNHYHRSDDRRVILKLEEDPVVLVERL